jgi:hypothetical protein
MGEMPAHLMSERLARADDDAPSAADATHP